MPAVFPTRKTRFHAAYNCIVSCLLKSHSLSLHRLDGRSIVKNFRVSVSGPYAFYGFYLQFIRCILVHSHQQPRTHHSRMNRCIKHHHCQVVCNIPAHTVHTAYCQAFAAEAPALTNLGSTAIPDFARVVHLNKGYLQQLLRKGRTDFSGFHISHIVWIQPLIHSAVGY